MASGHVHSIKLENGNYYHMFNLSFMNADEISVLQNLLNGQPVDQKKLSILNGIKQSVEEIINMAVVKDTQPKAERIDFAAEVKAMNESKEVDGKTIDEEKDKT